MKHKINVPRGYDLVLLSSVGSTNDELKKLAINENIPEGKILWSRKQTSGRGRFGRSWISNEGNMYLSVLFRPECPPYVAAQIGFLPAIAARMSIKAIAGQPINISYKWPNDLLVGSKKVGGTLIESRSGMDGLAEWVVAGFGLNVENFPQKTSFPATCLKAEIRKSIKIDKLVESYLFNIAKLYDTWQKNGFEVIRNVWLSSAVGLNQFLEVKVGLNNVTGIFRNLDEDGSMVLETSSGVTKVTAGEVYSIGETK